MQAQVQVVENAPRCVLGEGPFWDSQSARLLFVDIVGQRVHALDPGRSVESWRTPQVVSAVVPDRRGGLILALQDGVYRFSPKSQDLQLFCRPDPNPANRSNEARCDPQGRLWLGTMQNNIGPAGEAQPVTSAGGGLFVIHADGRSQRLLSDISIANTLAWSPDGAHLFFADSRRNLIWRFRYEPEGPALRDQEVFVDGGPGVPDGSAMDADGFLWTARWGGGCIARYAPDGRLDALVEVPARQPSSCAFGDEDLRALYVTTARHGLKGEAGETDGRLLRLRTPKPGLPLPAFGG